MPTSKQNNDAALRSTAMNDETTDPKSTQAVEAQVEAATKTEVATDAAAEAKTEAATDAMVEAQTEAAADEKAEAASDVTAETQAEPEAKTGTKTDAAAEAATKAEADAAADAVSDATADNETDATVDANTESKDDAQRASRGRRIARGVVKVVLTLAFIVACNAAAMFALDPYGSKSQVIWHEYYQEESIDTIFLGTSLSARSFDPAVIDKVLGTHSFNLSTPGQWIEESYLGLQTVVDDHDIKNVVLGFEYSEVQGEKVPDPGRPFVRYMNQNDLGKAARDTLWLLSNPRCYTETTSINWLFPWIGNHVKMTPSSVATNIRMKLDGTNMLDAAAANEKGWTYYGHGYGNYAESVYDFNTSGTSTLPSKYGRKTFDKEKLQTLADFCDYCAERGINVLVVASPTPKFNVLDYGDKYFDQADQIAELVEAHGGEYYDLNLAKPELLSMREGDFADYQHLNTQGGMKTSSATAELIRRINAGEDTSDLFYDRDGYYAANTSVELLKAKATGDQTGVTVNAEAIASPDVEVEYRLCVQEGAIERNAEGKEILADASGEEGWVEVQAWTTDPALEFTPDENREYRFRVQARAVGSDEPYERYRLCRITV